MASFTFTAAHEHDTARLGAALAAVLPVNAVISLMGTLGAGKTRLVQAVAKASGVPDETVLSPTFTLCHEYHGGRTIYHFDAYRLADEDEFDALGPEECFQSPALTFVEWGDRVQRSFPEERIEIQIEVGPGEARLFRITSFGEVLESCVLELQNFLI